jgi:hypothetical protein
MNYVNLFAFGGHDIVRWIIPITIASFFVLFFILFPLLIFVAALLETGRVPAFRLLPESESIPDHPVLAEARSIGFALIGHFRHGDHGLQKRTIVILALSPNARVLLCIRHKMGARHMLMSRYASRRWMITSNLSGAADLSGLEMNEMLPDTSLQTLLNHHQSRLDSYPEVPLPFESATAPAALIQHDREQTEEMVRKGLARYTSADRSTGKMTFRGAARMTYLFIKQLRSLPAQAALARHKKQEQEWGVSANPDQFLIPDPPPFSSRPTTVDPPPPIPPPQSSAISQTPSASQAPPSSQSSDIPPLV